MLIEREGADLNEPPHTIASFQVQHGSDSADRLPGDGRRPEVGERTEKFADLGSATFAEHETVRAHPQCLSQQPGQPQSAGALEVGLSRLEGDDMWMLHPQLAHVLDRNDPFGRGSLPQQGRQQCGLSAASRAGDEQVLSSGDELPHNPSDEEQFVCEWASN